MRLNWPGGVYHCGGSDYGDTGGLRGEGGVGAVIFLEDAV